MKTIEMAKREINSYLEIARNNNKEIAYTCKMQAWAIWEFTNTLTGNEDFENFEKWWLEKEKEFNKIYNEK